MTVLFKPDVMICFSFSGQVRSLTYDVISKHPHGHTMPQIRNAVFNVSNGNVYEIMKIKKEYMKSVLARKIKDKNETNKTIGFLKSVCT